jgi:GTPase
MDFIDEVTFWVEGGHGGDGCVSFRREKFVPKGGPDGGEGGHGGSVMLRASPNVSTLYDLRHRKRFKASRGLHGKGKNMSGRGGKDIVLPIPVGTLISDAETDSVLADLTAAEETLVVAKGGKGGRGNSHFATSTRQAPDFAEPGKAGELRFLKLELKLLADVGLVGLPNSGKSTLLSRISAARPKIANYPFTTLVPNLGIVSLGEGRSFTVADIPGLIQGAHLGRGLGDRFLRHIERTRLLIVMIEASDPEPSQTCRILLDELRLFNAELLQKPRLTVFSKCDLLSASERDNLPKTLEGRETAAISGVTGEGIASLMERAEAGLAESAHG